MADSSHGRVAGRSTGVIVATLAAVAVMLAVFAEPVAAGSSLSSESDSVYEGHIVKVTITITNPPWRPMRYSYKTQDGSANSGTDFDSKSGYVSWPGAPSFGTKAEVTVQTKQDQVCEYTEDFKVVLTNPQVYWASLGKWYAAGGGAPSRFEAVAEIDQHERGCTAGQFGE